MTSPLKDIYISEDSAPIELLNNPNYVITPVNRIMPNGILYFDIVMDETKKGHHFIPQITKTKRQRLIFHPKKRNVLKTKKEVPSNQDARDSKKEDYHNPGKEEYQEDKQERIYEIVKRIKKPTFEEEPMLLVTLFDFQKKCLERMLELVKERKGWSNNGALLFLEMGFGKTLVALALVIEMAKDKKKEMKNVLVVVSGKDLAEQWKNEISSKSNFPRQKIFIVHSLKMIKELYRMTKDNEPCIMIITYHSFSRMSLNDISNFADVKLSMIVLDEAQFQRNVNTNMFINMEKFLERLAEKPFMLLGTGTPYVNRIYDLAGLTKILNVSPPCEKHDGQIHNFVKKVWWSALGREKKEIAEEYECWKRMFIVTIEPEEALKVTESWGFKTFKYVYELPNEGISFKAYSILSHFFTLLFTQIQSVKAKKMMIEIKQSIFRTIIFMCMMLHHPATVVSKDSQVRKQTFRSKGRSSNEQLRDVFKMCDLTDEELSWETPSVKLTKVIEIIETIRTNKPDEKVIVCCDYATFLCILYLHLTKPENVKKFGKPILYAGCGSQKTKSAGLEAFKAESTEFSILLIVTEKAIGLNLQRANHVIFTSASWNPSIDQQAECRVKRPGQKRDVHIYRIFTKGTIDVWQFWKLNQKYEQQLKWLKGIPEKTTHQQFEEKAKELFRLIRGEDRNLLETIQNQLYDLPEKLSVDKLSIDYEKLKVDQEKITKSFETYEFAMANLTYLSDHIREENKKNQKCVRLLSSDFEDPLETNDDTCDTSIIMKESKSTEKIITETSELIDTVNMTQETFLPTVNCQTSIDVMDETFVEDY